MADSDAASASAASECAVSVEARDFLSCVSFALSSRCSACNSRWRRDETEGVAAAWFVEDWARDLAGEVLVSSCAAWLDGLLVALAGGSWGKTAALAHKAASAVPTRGPCSVNQPARRQRLPCARRGFNEPLPALARPPPRLRGQFAPGHRGSNDAMAARPRRTRTPAADP